MYCKVSSSVSLVNIVIKHSYKIFFLMTRTFKICSLNNFQIYDPMLLTIVMMLYIISPWHLFYNWKLVYITFTHFSHPLPHSPILANTDPFTISASLVVLLLFWFFCLFLDSTHKCFWIQHINEMIRYMLFSVRSISFILVCLLNASYNLRYSWFHIKSCIKVP